jgi:hypothetical protein
MDRWSTEIAPFESKTKEDYEWRANTLVPGSTMIEVDIRDKGVNRAGTILEFK